MADEGVKNGYIIAFDEGFVRILKDLKRKKPDLFRHLEKVIGKVARLSLLGKPLRNVLRNYRRMHMGSFVLLYEICGKEIRFLDFDHHDKIYKKYQK